LGSLKWNQQRVPFKLIPASIAGQVEAVANEQSPKSHKATLKKVQSNTQSVNFPKGLVGIRTTASVVIAGKETNCLLDTGSQVTTVPQSFYDQHLSDLPIQPLGDLLDVEGANGQLVPYLGFVELSITFPKDFVGSEINVNTLALVILPLRAAAQEQVLVGTNTLDALYADFHESSPNFKPAPYGFRALLKILEIRQKTSCSSSLGCAKLQDKSQTVVQAGQTTVFEAMVYIPNPVAEKCAIIEQPSASPLPSSLLVLTSLVDLPVKKPCKLPVIIKNETDHDIVVLPGSVLADVNAITRVLQKEQMVKMSSSPDRSKDPTQSKKMSFDFGNSLLPVEWKERVTEMLNSMPRNMSWILDTLIKCNIK